jgi:hypothetical protein
MCTQAGSANVLQNPGFDKDISGWTIDVGTLSRSLTDAEKCPYSGSLTTTVDAGSSREISQCVRNTPLAGDYNFGVRINGGGVPNGTSEASVICQVIFWSGFDCDADVVVTNETVTVRPGYPWQQTVPESSPAGTPVEGANSVSFTCILFGHPSSQTEFFLDMFYIQKTPGRF